MGYDNADWVGKEGMSELNFQRGQGREKSLVGGRMTEWVQTILVGISYRSGRVAGVCVWELRLPSLEWGGEDRVQGRKKGSPSAGDPQCVGARAGGRRTADNKDRELIGRTPIQLQAAQKIDRPRTNANHSKLGKKLLKAEAPCATKGEK